MRMNLILFYIFFEISLFPLVAIIIIWGYQVERIQARFYLFFYTMVGSFPFLIILLYFYLLYGFFNWNRFVFLKRSWKHFYLVWILIFRFFIKLPVYGVHIWLPKAHVEAPALGSIILAGVLLKVGGYGFYRFFFLTNNLNFSFVIMLALWGGFISSFIRVIQTDLKSLVAYSSVSHMGVILCGLGYFINIGVFGAFVILISHGFCSSALFYMVNVNYERNLSRQLVLLRGNINYFWMIYVFWFLFLIINFRVPPFLSLFGELFIFFILYSDFFFFFYLFLGF